MLVEMSKRNHQLLLLLWMLLVPLTGFGGGLAGIQKALAKDNLAKAEKLIVKALQKDSTSAGAWYFYSQIWIHPDFDRYHIDSAYWCAVNALTYREQASEKQLKALNKLGLDTAILRLQRRTVERLAFERATETMTLDALEYFRMHFPKAHYQAQATALRDSVAYVQAATLNTWESFQQYFQAYPDSRYASEARTQYQHLIFNDYTKDDRLESYIRFLKEFPNTPHRLAAEKIIFERSTRAHNLSAFSSFVQEYPRSPYSRRAADIWYHLAVQQGLDVQPVLHHHPAADSLKELHQLNAHVLFPIWENERFGFYTLTGQQLIPPSFTEIDKALTCGNIRGDVLMVNMGGTAVLVNRNGAALSQGLSRYVDCGSGILQITTGDERTVLHKSGFAPLSGPVQEVQALRNGWLMYRQDYRWGVHSLSGMSIVQPVYDEITERGPFLIFEQNERFGISNTRTLTEDGAPSLLFDDYEVIGDSLLLAFNGQQETLLDKNLQPVIPLGNHQIYPGPVIYLKANESVRLYSAVSEDIMSRTFTDIRMSESWLALKKDSIEWLLVSRNAQRAQLITQLDSVLLLGSNAAWCRRKDSTMVVFSNGSLIHLKKHEALRLISPVQPDRLHAGLLAISDAKSQRVLDMQARELFRGKYEELALLTDTLFRFKRSGKVGVMSWQGKELVPATYEMVDEQDGLLFLLKSGKIGAYDLVNDIHIPTEYEARIERLGSNLYQIMKNGKVGVAATSGKPRLSPSFDQIWVWNDTSVWTRQADEWTLRTLENEVLIKGVSSVRPWLEIKGEKLYTVLTPQGQGLYSQWRGQLLPPQYNDIVNVGTDLEPVFLAEEHLKTAAFFVVTYFDLQGKPLRSQAFRPAEYERIYCDQ